MMLSNNNHTKGNPFVKLKSHLTVDFLLFKIKQSNEKAKMHNTFFSISKYTTLHTLYTDYRYSIRLICSISARYIYVTHEKWGQQAKYEFQFYKSLLLPV